jgi:hypothetical protein
MNLRRQISLELQSSTGLETGLVRMVCSDVLYQGKKLWRESAICAIVIISAASLDA